MALTNWPPATAPSWPPPGYINLEAGSYDAAVQMVQECGATTAQPNGQERSAYFNNARCNDGHTVQGIMVVWPNGTKYPFARCTDVAHLEGLVLWDPFYATTNP